MNRHSYIMDIKKAVIDRIVDQTQAVLLVGPEEKEWIVSVDQLPEGAAEGDCLQLNADGTIALDESETTDRAEVIVSKLDLLKKRSQTSRFNK